MDREYIILHKDDTPIIIFVDEIVAVYLEDIEGYTAAVIDCTNGASYYVDEPMSAVLEKLAI